MTEWIGQQLGKYRLVRLLGKGGFAEVYLGQHQYLNTPAAIKVLYTSLEVNDIEDFLREAGTVANLTHPHIVRVFDFDVENHIPFLVMNYFPNGNIRHSYPKGVPLPLEKVITYVKQVTSALQYAHDQKIIHRDIKPENMLLDQDNSIVLSDFGIAVMAQSSAYDDIQEIAGTAAYMAPEQFQGQPHRASDQYALGIVVYEWLTGDHPFHGSFSELANQHLFVPPPPLNEKMRMASFRVEQVVLKALEKDLYKRFASVEAFAAALEEAFQAKPSSRIASSTKIPFASEPSLSNDSIATLSPSQTSITIPANQSLPPTLEALPTTRESTTFTQSQSLRSKPHISRRAVLMGLTGLAVAGAGITGTWLSLSQKKQVSNPAFRSNNIPGSTPTLFDQPIGTTLLTYHGHSQTVYTLAWSPDGKHIASGGRDNTVQIWDAATGNTLIIYQGHSQPVADITWSPDGQRIASASYDSTVQIWDAASSNTLVTYQGHSQPVFAALWSSDGKRITSDDYTVKVWDTETGSTLYSYRDPSSIMIDMAVSPDGKRITSGGEGGGTVKVFDSTTGQNVLAFQHTDSNQIFTVEWSPDGKLIACGGSGSHTTVEVFNASTGENVLICEGDLYGVADIGWSPNGRSIAGGSFDHKLLIWDAATGKNIYTYLEHLDSVNAVEWSPDGTRIASAGGNNQKANSDTAVRVWKAI